jgi:4-hydroxy-tetrahydrodipicolinate reductase
VRDAGSIGFSVVRAGDIVGEHTVIFAGAGERWKSRTAPPTATPSPAARCGPPNGWPAAPGLYGMQDVLMSDEKHGQPSRHR